MAWHGDRYSMAVGRGQFPLLENNTTRTHTAHHAPLSQRVLVCPLFVVVCVLFLVDVHSGVVRVSAAVHSEASLLSALCSALCRCRCRCRLTVDSSRVESIPLRRHPHLRSESH